MSCLLVCAFQGVFLIGGLERRVADASNSGLCVYPLDELFPWDAEFPAQPLHKALHKKSTKMKSKQSKKKKRTMRHCSFTSVLCDISVLSFCFPACFRASCVLNSSLVYSLCLLLLLPFSFLIYLNTLFFILPLLLLLQDFIGKTVGCIPYERCHILTHFLVQITEDPPMYSTVLKKSN